MDGLSVTSMVDFGCLVIMSTVTSRIILVGAIIEAYFQFGYHQLYFTR